MRDPFERARLAHEKAKLGALGQTASSMPKAPAAPGKAPGPSVAPMVPAGGAGFAVLAKKLGVDHLQLSGDPVVARTKLMEHLQQSMGPDYMSHPDVKNLFQAFGQHEMSRDEKAKARAQASSAGLKTMKALMG